MSDEGPVWTQQRFRFSKFYLNTLFDGRLHLVRRGDHFPQSWTEQIVAKKLRAAAWWRRTTIRLSHCPQGVWVQSAEAVSDGLTLDEGERERLAQLMDQNTMLKQQLTELRRELWQLKNQ